MPITKIDVDSIRFVKEFYPRLREDDATIERYRDALDRLPPITIARDGVLVDGFHRWQAYKREGIKEIQAENIGNLADTEIIMESVRRNSRHGHQLNTRDKRRMADLLWRQGVREESSLCELLSITASTLETYLRDAKRDEKEEQKARAWDLWLDCRTQEAIAGELGVTHQSISNWVQKTGSDPEFCKPPESRQHFDVWSFAKADGDSSYFGRMPPQVVENLLWLYTEPGQVVVDLFAGGGTTIEVAKRMGRRVWASDLTPSTPTLPIHRHDATSGWPADAPQKADLVILDPPYWQQAKGRYSDAEGDLANMPIDAFYAAWKAVVSGCMKHAKRIAYIISPTQLDDGRVVDHATDMLDAFGTWNVERRIIVPYQTQQATGQQVVWARDNRRLLKLYRDLVVMRYE